MPGRSIGLLFQGWSRGNPASIPNYTICRLGSNPHSRGVYRAATAPALRTTGSSPLARGLRPQPWRRCRPRGIIPARAGFTRRARGQALRPQDHPRSRGVYIRPLASGEKKFGSSPLARGLHTERRAHDLRPGIIPARAGFTTSTAKPLTPPPDHPRSRGVYTGRIDVTRSVTGSSPLARGLRAPVGGPDEVAGIIPARAGFTSPVPQRRH